MNLLNRDISAANFNVSNLEFYALGEVLSVEFLRYGHEFVAVGDGVEHARQVDAICRRKLVRVK